MFDNMFKGVMGRILPGKCRLSLNGRIAIQTSDGYKTYNDKTGNLTNCSNFVLDLADDLFMVIPTWTLKPGDIVIINGKPMYILDIKSKNRVEAMNYEDNTIQTVIPERHAIMGRRFYGKIVSLMGKGFTGGKGGFFKNMLKLKMMSSMMGGSKSVDGMFSSNNALPMMMLMSGGSMDGLFDGIMSEDGEDGNADFSKMFSDADEDGSIDAEADEESVMPKTKTKTSKKSKTVKSAKKTKTVRK